MGLMVVREVAVIVIGPGKTAGGYVREKEGRVKGQDARAANVLAPHLLFVGGEAGRGSAGGDGAVGLWDSTGGIGRCSIGVVVFWS